MWEALAVAAVGVGLALAANQISPRGLSLTRNYFPEIKPVPTPAARVTNAPPSGVAAPTNTAASSPSPPQSGGEGRGEEAPRVQGEAAAALEPLKAKGLQVVSFDQVKQFLHDPSYAQGSIIFVDARDDDHYQAGHIPGAYQLDYYHPEKYLATVLPACQSAKQIVVYCTGGDCEDSEMTAIMLRDGGIPNEKLFVYSGGWNEWEPSGQPIETGARNSGYIKANK